ncbi:hypothetical protein ACP6OV_003350 [Cronobacter muytjensii]
MKLIDLLVQELPKRGGWPDGVYVIEQGSEGYLLEIESDYKSDFRLQMADDWLPDCVTREQYEAALAAAQQPVWDGEGLPPVGCECEVSVCGGWEPGRIVFSDENIGVAYVCESTLSPTLDCVSGFSALKHFRPIRSEADKRRDAIISAIEQVNNQCPHSDAVPYAVYDAIAAGKIPHIRIE